MVTNLQLKNCVNIKYMTVYCFLSNVKTSCCEKHVNVLKSSCEFLLCICSVEKKQLSETSWELVGHKERTTSDHATGVSSRSGREGQDMKVRTWRSRREGQDVKVQDVKVRTWRSGREGQDMKASTVWSTSYGLEYFTNRITNWWSSQEHPLNLSETPSGARLCWRTVCMRSFSVISVSCSRSFCAGKGWVFI